MKPKKGKKGKKKKNLEEQTIITRHDRIGNNNYYGEEIVKEIIDKIISKTISINFRNNVEKQIPLFSFNKIKHDINNILSTLYIPYDYDDLYTTAIIKEEKKLSLSFNGRERNKYIHLNINNDSLNNSFEKSIMKIKPDISIQFNNKKNHINYWGSVTQPGEFKKDRYASTLIKNKNYEPFAEFLTEEKKTSKETKKSTKFFKPIKIINKIKNKIEKISPTKAKKNIEFPSYNIPEEKFKKNEELPEVIKLREEKKELIKQKMLESLEEKRKIEELKQIKNNSKYQKLSKEEIMFQKKLKSHNFTIDFKGEIVFIKKIPLEDLMNEFGMVQSNQIQVNNQIEKKTTTNFLKTINNENKENNENQTDNSKDKEIEIIYNSNSNSSSNYNSNNPIQKKFASAYNKIKAILPMRNNHFIQQREQPSGSNFEIFNPEVGVKITEDQKIKNGGNNFLKKFNKFSVIDFNNTLRETNEFMRNMNKTINLSNINNKNNLTNDFININNNNNILNNTSVNFHQKENSENIIIDKNIKKLIDNISNNNNESIINKKINYGSNFIEYNKHLNMNKSQSMGNIMISNLKYSNLKDVIEDIEYPKKNNKNNKFQNKFNETNKTSYNNKNNFFKVNPYQRNKDIIEKKNSFKQINYFNKSLLNNKFWGDNEIRNMTKNSSMIFPQIHYKPDQRSIEKELGNEIGKFPRDRIKISAQNALFNNKIIDFNKPKRFRYTDKNFFKPEQ